MASREERRAEKEKEKEKAERGNTVGGPNRELLGNANKSNVQSQEGKESSAMVLIHSQLFIVAEGVSAE
jgi:hypothetical protein